MLLCPSQSSAPTGGLALPDTTGGCDEHYEWEIDTLGADSEHCPDADYAFYDDDIPDAVFGNPAASEDGQLAPAVQHPLPAPVTLPVTQAPSPPPPPAVEPRRAREESLDAWVNDSSTGYDLDGNLDGLELCPGGIDIDLWDCPTFPSSREDALRSPSPAARVFSGRTAQTNRQTFARDLPAATWTYIVSAAVNCNAPAVRTMRVPQMLPAHRAAAARTGNTRDINDLTTPIIGAAVSLSAARMNSIPAWTRTKAFNAVVGVQLENRHIAKASRPAKMLFSQENLARVYHLPRETAAVELGIGCTYLKKICRGYGIKRWPSRKLAALNNHISELTLLVTPRVSQACADVVDDMTDAIADAENTKDRIYKDPNHTITRDLYRELHTFRKRVAR